MKMQVWKCQTCRRNETEAALRGLRHAQIRSKTNGCEAHHQEVIVRLL